MVGERAASLVFQIRFGVTNQPSSLKEPVAAPPAERSHSNATHSGTAGQSEWHCCGSSLQVCGPFPELCKPSLSCPGSTPPCLPQAAVTMAKSQTPIPLSWWAPTGNGFHQCRNHPFFPTFPTPWLQLQFVIWEKDYLGWWIEQITFSPVFSISWHSLLFFFLSWPGCCPVPPCPTLNFYFKELGWALILWRQCIYSLLKFFLWIKTSISPPVLSAFLTYPGWSEKSVGAQFLKCKFFAIAPGSGEITSWHKPQWYCKILGGKKACCK